MPILKSNISKQWISFADLERLVGKLVSLEIAVSAGMWYTREQSSASGGMEHVDLFLTIKYWIPLDFKHQTVMVQAEISSDASGRCFAGIVDFVQGPTSITAGEFEDQFLHQDIQVKEGEALRST